jgi:nicotinamidase-related amidase
MKLLMVVDMQNDFAHPDGAIYGGKHCEYIIPFICDRIMEYRNNNDMIIISMDTHKKNDKQFKIWPKHCVYKTWGWELVDPIKEISTGCTIIKKTKFSAFYKTDLDDLINVDGIEVEVVGLFTSMCILHTIADLYNRDASIIIPSDGTADADPEDHIQGLKYIRNIYKAQVK